jgi:NifU-like protein involved in Fe-S cluster formation
MMEFFVAVEDDTVVAVRFWTTGCVASRAAGAMAAEMALGRDVQSARAIVPNEVLAALGGGQPETEHCAVLAVNTLRAALDHHVAEALRDWKKLYRKRRS